MPGLSSARRRGPSYPGRCDATDNEARQRVCRSTLLTRGLIDHDPFALGINALPTGEVLRYRGGPIPWLFTLGAPLKGVLWESTALAEIREQAQGLADKLLTLSRVTV